MRSSWPATSPPHCAPSRWPTPSTPTSRAASGSSTGPGSSWRPACSRRRTRPSPARPSCCGVNGRTRTAPRPSWRGRRWPSCRATGPWPRPIRPGPDATSAAGRASAGRRGPTSRGGRHTSTPRGVRPGSPGRSAAPSPPRTRRRWTGSWRSSRPRRTSPSATSRKRAPCSSRSAAPGLGRPAQRASPPPPGPGRGRARGGDITAARRELKTGLTTLANQQARHHSLDLRTAMAVHGGRLAELDLRIALESGSARSVFTSLERWRAMSHRRTAVRPPRDEELADLLAGLRITTEEIRHSPPGRPVEHLRRRQRAFERVGPGTRVDAARGRSRRALRHARRHPATARPAGHRGRRLLRAGPPSRCRHRRPRAPSRGHLGCLVRGLRPHVPGPRRPRRAGRAHAAAPAATGGLRLAGPRPRQAGPPAAAEPAHRRGSRSSSSPRAPSPPRRGRCSPGGWDGPRRSPSPPPVGSAARPPRSPHHG